MAMPFGISNPTSIETLTAQQNQPSNDWEVIPDACKQPMKDNGDGTWEVPQLAANCAVPILYNWAKEHGGDDFADIQHEDYAWRGSNPEDIAAWYYQDLMQGSTSGTVFRADGEVKTWEFLDGILQREKLYGTRLRDNSTTNFEVPEGAITPDTQGWLYGTAFDTAGKTFSAMQNLVDPANVVRIIAIVVGLGLVLFGARKAL